MQFQGLIFSYNHIVTLPVIPYALSASYYTSHQSMLSDLEGKKFSYVHTFSVLDHALVLFYYRDLLWHVIIVVVLLHMRRREVCMYSCQ